MKQDTNDTHDLIQPPVLIYQCVPPLSHPRKLRTHLAFPPPISTDLVLPGAIEGKVKSIELDMSNPDAPEYSIWLSDETGWWQTGRRGAEAAKEAHDHYAEHGWTIEMPEGGNALEVSR